MYIRVYMFVHIYTNINRIIVFSIQLEVCPNSSCRVIDGTCKISCTCICMCVCLCIIDIYVYIYMYICTYV